jgi:hypothetical protein
MAEVTKVTETSSQGLEPVNPKLISQYDQLRSLLASRLTADHAFLFAEPMPLRGAKESGKDTAWYVKGDGTVRALSSLPSDQAASIEHRVAVLVYDIGNLATELISDGGASRELGRLLQDALVFPDTAQVFLVDDRPVLVNWGYRRQAGTPGVGVAGGLLSGVARARSTPERAVTIDSAAAAGVTSSPASGAASSATAQVLQNEQQDQPEPGARRRFDRRRWAAAALWSVFVLISGLIGLRLLDACALGSSKWPGFIRSLAANHCSVGNSPDLQAVNDTARALEATIRQKQLVVAANLAKCEATCPPAPQPVINQTPNRADVDRALTPDIRRGKIEVTLAWKGPADLDLHIICPDGKEIKRGALRNCGGEFVTDDLNVGGGGNDDKTWIEHVIWSATPVPNGKYQVRAVLYTRSRDSRPAIPAIVILRVNGTDVKTATPSFSTPYEEITTRASDTIFTFEVPADVAGGGVNAR